MRSARSLGLLIGVVFGIFAGLVAHVQASPGTSTFDVPPWLLRSNLIALQFTRDLADRNPEIGSMMGYTDFDALAIRVDNDMEGEDEAFFSKWQKTAQGLLKNERHIEFRRDIRLLAEVLRYQVESIRLDRKYRMIPFYKLTRLVMGNLRPLDSPMMLDRLKAVPARFHTYVNGLPAVSGVPGSNPLATAYESRVRFLLKKYAKAKGGPTYPSKAEMDQYFKESASDLEELQKTIEKTKSTGALEDFNRFKGQVEKYHAFIKSEIFPHAKADDRLPLEIYRWLLRSKSIGATEAELIKQGRAKYAAVKKDMTVLAAKVGKELGQKDLTFAGVIQTLKAKQLTQPAEVEKKYREAAAFLKKLNDDKSYVTAPDSPLDLKVGTQEESLAEPYPHLSHPPLAFSMGEKAFIILPALTSGKFPTDDFTYEAAVPALLAHEGRPGHEVYFQTLMDRGISVIRARYGYSIPAVEGWAFYAEDLVYPDLPAVSQMVILQMRAWALARMFLDPEVHLGRMKPDEAMRILMQEIGLSQPVAENELRRYSSEDPGQGTGYGYGYLKILEAKEKVRKRIGKGFSERCFNDAVIELGLLPIDWLDEELKSLKCPELAPAFDETA